MSVTARAQLVFESSVPMPISRIVRAYLQEARYDFLQMLRAPAFAIPFLLMPTGLYILFAVLMAGSSPQAQANPSLATYLLSSFCAFGVMGPGIFGFGVMLSVDREQGQLKLKRALPMPLAAYLIAKMLMSTAFALIAAGGVVVAALAFGKVIVSTGTLLTLVGMLVLGAIPFCAIGMLIGACASAGAAPAWANLVYIPGMYLSGMFFPLPEILRPWAVIWPAFHLNQTALGVAGIAEYSFMPPMITGAVLVGITVLCGGLALRRLARTG